MSDFTLELHINIKKTYMTTVMRDVRYALELQFPGKDKITPCLDAPKLDIDLKRGFE